MFLILFLLPSVTPGPLPEFNLQTGGRGVQKKIPAFDGIDWPRSKRGVCYDKGSEQSVRMGQQFYLDCGRCTCDRYGFWCVPKCVIYVKPDLENCVEIVDIPDPCCPRQECLKYKDPSKGPTTDPWAKGTMTQDNGVDKLMDKTTSVQTESVTVTVTLDEGEQTTKPATSPDSTTQFGGAFTTGSTQKPDSRVSTESTTEIQTPTVPLIDDESGSASPETAATPELITPDFNERSSDSSQPSVVTEETSPSSKERSEGYVTGTPETTESETPQSEEPESEEPADQDQRKPQDDSPTVSSVYYTMITVTEGSIPSEGPETTEGTEPSPSSEQISTGYPGPQSTSPESTTDTATREFSEYPVSSQSASSENPSVSSENPSVSPSDIPSASASPSSQNPSDSTRDSSGYPSVSMSVPSENPSDSTSAGSKSPAGTPERTEDSFSRSSLQTELISSAAETVSSTEESGIQSTPDYY